MNPTRIRLKRVLTILGFVYLLTYALLSLSFFIPELNPLKPPRVELSNPLARLASRTTDSAGQTGAVVTGAILTLSIVVRPGIFWPRRLLEMMVILLIGGCLMAMGSYLNEHVIKPAIRIPRPDILFLASHPADDPILGMTAEGFYGIADKRARSEHLMAVLKTNHRAEIDLNDLVSAHWIRQTGYSFPSGHAFVSMMLAGFFLALGLDCYSRRFSWLYGLPVLWAIAVCYTRPILWLHTPVDIFAGSVLGGFSGILAFLAVYLVMKGIDSRKQQH